MPLISLYLKASQTLNKKYLFIKYAVLSISLNFAII